MDANSCFMPSDKIISRDIMGKLIIVSIESGIADFDDAMFSFNETGSVIWKCIEQKKPFHQICSTMENEFDSSIDQIEKGVKSLLSTLLEKNIIVEWKP